MAALLLVIHYAWDLPTTRKAIALGAHEENPFGVKGSTFGTWAAVAAGFIPLLFPQDWEYIPTAAVWLFPLAAIFLKIRASLSNQNIIRQLEKR